MKSKTKKAVMFAIKRPKTKNKQSILLACTGTKARQKQLLFALINKPSRSEGGSSRRRDGSSTSLGVTDSIPTF